MFALALGFRLLNAMLLNVVIPFYLSAFSARKRKNKIIQEQLLNRLLYANGFNLMKTVFSLVADTVTK